MLKDMFEELKDKFSIKKDSSERNLKSWLSNMKYNITGIDEDGFGENKITVDVVKVWINHLLSVITGFGTGFWTYCYCGAKYLNYQEQLVGYQVGVYTSPPSQLWFMMIILWSAVASLLLSVVIIGAVHLAMWLGLTRNLDYAKDIQMTGIALTCLFYVLVVIVFCLIGVSIPKVFL